KEICEAPDISFCTLFRCTNGGNNTTSTPPLLSSWTIFTISEASFKPSSKVLFIFQLPATIFFLMPDIFFWFSYNAQIYGICIYPKINLAGLSHELLPKPKVVIDSSTGKDAPEPRSSTLTHRPYAYTAEISMR